MALWYSYKLKFNLETIDEKFLYEYKIYPTAYYDCPDMKAKDVGSFQPTIPTGYKIAIITNYIESPDNAGSETWFSAFSMYKTSTAYIVTRVSNLSGYPLKPQLKIYVIVQYTKNS